MCSASILRPLTAALLFVLAALPAFAQTARVQVIHNSPDPGAEVVDIYLDDALLLDDLAFRKASAFIDAPAGTPIEIDVAPGTSTSAADAIATFSYTLAAGETYQLIATGVLDPMMFAPNPDDVSTAFTLLVNATAQEAATDGSEVQFSVVHGAPDAPTVDVVARGVGTLVDDAVYQAITPYLGVPPADYTLDVTTADGSTVVASFTAPLAASAGAALSVLASGFLDPSQNQDGPAFGLLAVFADGATLVLPQVTSNEAGTEQPGGFTLRGNYPNPFNPSTNVVFDLPARAEVTVEVFDVLGRRVLATPAAAFEAGANQRLALDAAGLPSGAYVYRLTAETAGETLAQTGRMTLLK